MIKYPESKVQVLPEETEFSVRISHTLTSKFMETIHRLAPACERLLSQCAGNFSLNENKQVALI